MIGKNMNWSSRVLAMAGLWVMAPLSHAGDCAPVDGIESICDLMAPEDIVIAPNGRDLIFGQFGAGGRLSLLDTRDDSVHTLYSGAGEAPPSEQLWGDSSCTAPPATLWPHGIDLRQRADGRWQLLVVNHAERESVEFFELQLPEGERAQLKWRGCAIAPAGAHLNEVTSLPDGGFLSSNMYGAGPQLWIMTKALLGFDTGFIYRWHSDSGFEEVAGTGGRMPNGITLGPAGESFFVDVYFDDELRKYDLASGQLLATTSISKPDNVTLTADGRLLVASHLGSLLDIQSSLEQPAGTLSLLPFAIVEVDPHTLEQRILLEHEGAPMGAGTVAVELGGFWYIGSYAGDRMIKVPLPAGR